mgnify:CR=1 FL=1
MTQTCLSHKQRLLVAGTLFGMFFGAGNLIFPVHLGQLAGRQFLPAAIGFILTAVGIPILGVAAIGSTHSEGLQDLSRRVGHRYSYFFTCLLYLTIGPFFAIPRCATTSFTAGVRPLLGTQLSEQTMLFLFSLIFFALVFVFSIRPGSITLWIGKIINPLFLLFLGVLIVTALLHPSIAVSGAVPDASYQNGAFFSALSQGYETMDAIAGLAFGIVVISVIRQMGVREDSIIAKEVLHSGMLAGLLMAFIYLLTILIGVQSLGQFELSENGGIALAQIAQHYLGSVGLLILAATVTLACLKTSVGLITSCAETFTGLFPKGPTYRVWAVIFSLVSLLFANFGLSSIIGYSVPVLMFLYPLAITLIALSLFGKFFAYDRAVFVWTTALTLVGALYDFAAALPAPLLAACRLDGVLAVLRETLPLAKLGLFWLCPALLGLVIGLILHFVRSKANN